MGEMSDETIDRAEDVMLPGFRFHPTDEELVGFYLQRKIQNRPLPVELIKQVDIYKYEPWDLPKFAATGEKEWYFYCPRDRKYRNSARPNRVTGAGFWKATGTDRPIYSSDGSKCIGLKKSLVFYRGRAAKGIKTDWMMHEFRLPSLSDHHSPQPAPKNKQLLDKSLPANEAWAICRIFKKTSSMAQRALSHSWMSQYFPEASPSHEHHILTSPDQAFNSDNLSCTTASFSPQDPIASFKQPLFSVSNGQLPINNYFTEASSQLLNSALLEPHPMMNQFTSLAQEMMCRTENEETERRKNDGVQPETIIRSIGFPFTLPDAWRHNNLPWDSPTCPSEMSTATYSPDKSYS